MTRHWALGEIALGEARPDVALASFERARAVADRRDAAFARVLADVDFGTARALAALHRDRRRARALAESARVAYTGYPELVGTAHVIDAWLADHPVRE
jgi:hypothetical protein